MTIGDPVNHPEHYTSGNIECLDAIKAALGENYKYYVQGNLIKYIWRFPLKNGVQDLRKAQFYLNDLLENYDDTD
ncbi:nucleotide kinase [Phage C72C1]|nr:nucleotide kinase [Phage C72C1]